MSEQASVKALYTKKSDVYTKFFIDMLGYQRGIEAFFREHTDWFRKDMRILDAGTGTGTLVKALYTILPRKTFASLQLSAFDLTPVMLQKFAIWIKELGLRNIRYFEADILVLDDVMNQYDLVMSSAMLEYLPKSDFPRAIALLKRSLKKNGKLLLFISRSNILNLFLIKIWWKANLYAKKELTHIFENAGFHTIRFHSFPGKYRYLNLWGYVVSAESAV